MTVWQILDGAGQTVEIWKTQELAERRVDYMNKKVGFTKYDWNGPTYVQSYDPEGNDGISYDGRKAGEELLDDVHDLGWA
jgi:hypothetical protein